eukprot:11443065-Alexandrium_andersonii.AAC.1
MVIDECLSPLPACGPRQPPANEEATFLLLAGALTELVQRSPLRLPTDSPSPGLNDAGEARAAPRPREERQDSLSRHQDACVQHEPLREPRIT